MLNGMEGYHCLHVEDSLTHIFYMKLFANNQEAIESMPTTVDKGSKVVGTSLGLQKREAAIA